MKAETGHYKITGQDVRLIHTARQRLVKTNKALIAFYVVFNAIGVAAAYFVDKWEAVGLALLVLVISTLIGLYMIKEAITITNEVR
jgi:hypothetical protein